MKVGFKTDRGIDKKANEDSLHVDTERGLYIVADGMGGHNGGEIASHIAVQQIASCLAQGPDCGEETSKMLEQAVAGANKAIYVMAASDPWWNEMGTTVVAALFRDRRLHICHVGDSRAYMVKAGSIKQLTQDHTFVAEWVKDGSITPEQARTHEARHGLTMALGVEEEVDPETMDLDWNPADSLLLCSDGLTEVLEDEAILDIVTRFADPQDACDALVCAANEKGGPDNISVILVRS